MHISGVLLCNNWILWQNVEGRKTRSSISQLTEVKPTPIANRSEAEIPLQRDSQQRLFGLFGQLFPVADGNIGKHGNK